MAVDDFLLIASDEWIEIENATHVVNVNGGPSNAQGIIDSGVFAPFDEYDGIKETAYLPEGNTVIDARMFNTGDPVEPIHLWIKIAPV